MTTNPIMHSLACPRCGHGLAGCTKKTVSAESTRRFYRCPCGEGFQTIETHFRAGIERRQLNRYLQDIRQLADAAERALNGGSRES